MTLEPAASKLETTGLETAEYPADRDAAVLELDGASVDVLAKDDSGGSCCREPDEAGGAPVVLEGPSVGVVAADDDSGVGACRDPEAGGAALEVEGASVRVLATEDSEGGPSGVPEEAGGAALEPDVVSEGGCDVGGAEDDSEGAGLVLSDCKLDSEDDAAEVSEAGGTAVEDNGQ